MLLPIEPKHTKSRRMYRDLTRHKISDRWRERAWLRVKRGSHRKLERGAASGSLHRLVRPRQEEDDSRDHDVCENVRYPWSEHAASASPNDSHEQPIDTGEAHAAQAAREPSNMDCAEGDGLQQKSRESGPE